MLVAHPLQIIRIGGEADFIFKILQIPFPSLLQSPTKTSTTSLLIPMKQRNDTSHDKASLLALQVTYCVPKRWF